MTTTPPIKLCHQCNQHKPAALTFTLDKPFNGSTEISFCVDCYRKYEEYERQREQEFINASKCTYTLYFDEE